METNRDQPGPPRDTRAENWKKNWRGTSRDLRKGQSRHKQVQTPCANVRWGEVHLFARFVFNSRNRNLVMEAEVKESRLGGWPGVP